VSLTEKKLRIFAWRFFALQVVTPFTPFVLSDAYFSPEIEKYGLQKLNPKSINLAKTRKMPSLKNPVIFVQVDQLATFCSTILGDIFQPFTLITGKWHLPPLQEDGYTQEILENPFLTEWYSQNQVYSNLPILPFPYGVELTSAPHIWWRMRLRGIFGLGRSGVFVPHVRIHRHLAGSALQTRQELHSLASPRLPLAPYLGKILRHRFVISPPGDRLDTYRHWECVALGAVPVSNLPHIFSELFGDGMIFVDSLADFVRSNPKLIRPAPNARLASVRYWRDRVKNQGFS